MRIAFSAKKENSEYIMDERFARADLFLIYDTEKQTYEEFDNASIQESTQGAGVRAAEFLVRRDVHAVVTGKCGPKALDALRSVDIPVHMTKQYTVDSALRELQSEYGKKNGKIE